MSYVEGYVLPIARKNLDVYRRMAQKAGSLWRKHGAIEYRECAGDDLAAPWCLSFTKLLKLKPGETVVLAWIVFKSKAHRDRVNAKVMRDPRLAAMMPKTPPFNPKRMAYAGFKILVDA